MSWSAVLSWDGGEVEIGDGSARGGVNATAEGIEGWYSTPASKWELTERTTADGAFSIDDADVLYGARTVTLNLYVEGDTRDEVVANHLALLAATHRECELRVVDGSHDTYCVGYVTVDDDAGTVSRTRDEATVTMVCPDPRRLASDGTDGCRTLTVDAVLEDDGGESITAGGVATCYPVVTVTGEMPSGFYLYMVTSDSVQHTTSYTAAVAEANPVVLDFNTRRATVGGVDYSKYLSARGFEGIEPGQSASFSLVVPTGSTGYAEVVCRDTYV